MKTFKNVLKTIIYMIGIAMLIVINAYGIKYIKAQNTKYTLCGTVVSGFEKNRTHKSNVYRDLYMGVKFDNGTIEALDVSPTTYMSKKVGDRVCFNFAEFKKMPNWQQGLGAIGIVVVCMELFVLLAMFCIWLWDGKVEV